MSRDSHARLRCAVLRSSFFSSTLILCSQLTSGGLTNRPTVQLILGSHNYYHNVATMRVLLPYCTMHLLFVIHVVCNLIILSAFSLNMYINY